ncbi:MAG TPA: ParB/RepB/Spo0J family partition protein [Myxococcota bacterium]|nr:ParB/RepB/Spo0J family partition protein [Myxococcota bacterium]
MTNKPKVTDRLALLTAAPADEAAANGGASGQRDAVRSVSPFMPMRHAAAAGEALTARIATLEAELNAEKSGRSSDHEQYQNELARLRRIAAEAGDSAGEFALLDPTTVADVLPADRLPSAFADSSFDELLDDIKANGQHDAITVRRTETGFEIASGRRRLEACKRLGIQVLVRIRPLDHEGMLGVQFSENERRQDIAAIERARWLAQVKERYGRQVQQLADDYRLDRTTVSLYLRLARLPEEIVERLMDARALPMLKARRLMAALEQDAGAMARVLGVLDSQLAAAEARGSRPSPDDQVEAAIRAAEGRSLPRGSDEAVVAIPNDKRVIVHRGRRVGTLIRNGGQWVVRFASTTDDRMVLAIAERISDLMEQIENERRDGRT